MKAAWMGLLGAILSAAAVCPAAASTVAYTITGTVLGGYDGSGLFGGRDLTNDAFTAVMTLDPQRAQSAWSNTSGSGANGGTHANGLTFARVALTINGSTIRFSDYTSNVSSLAGVQFNAFVQSSSGLDKNDIGFYVASPGIKGDYTQNQFVDGLSDMYAGYFTRTDDRGGQVVWANFEVNRLSSINAVPLPASAPLFGAGLLAVGAVGFWQRRFKRARSVA